MGLGFFLRQGLATGAHLAFLASGLFALHFSVVVGIVVRKNHLEKVEEEQISLALSYLLGRLAGESGAIPAPELVDDLEDQALLLFARRFFQDDPEFEDVDPEAVVPQKLRSELSSYIEPLWTKQTDFAQKVTKESKMLLDGKSDQKASRIDHPDLDEIASKRRKQLRNWKCWGRLYRAHVPVFVFAFLIGMTVVFAVEI